MRCPLHAITMVTTAHGRIVCPKCAITSRLSRAAHFTNFAGEWRSFNPKRLAMAYQVKGMSEADLAAALGVDEAQVMAMLAGSLTPLGSLVEKIAFATNFPPAFFYQTDPPSLDMDRSSWAIHEKLVFCECGHCLCAVGELSPAECPACQEPVDGCPKCDADLHVVERYNRKLKRYERGHECEKCHHYFLAEVEKVAKS